VLNTFFNECVPDRFPSKTNRPPWSTNALQRLKNLKTNTYKKYKKSGKPSAFSKYVVARSDFNVLNSHCCSMYLSRCKLEFSNDPKQFYNFVNAKRKSSALPSSVRFNSMEASTDSEIADLFAEFFQTTYSSAAWSNSNYPNPLNKANCIFTPEITEISLVRDLRDLSFVRQPYVNRFLNFLICLFHRQFFLLSGKTLLSFHFTKRVRRLMPRITEVFLNCRQFLKHLNVLLLLICNIYVPR